MSAQEDDMKDDYDFSNAVRGKFYHPNVKVRLPVYLKDDVASRVERYAELEGKNWTEMVNQLVERQLDLIEKSL